VRPPTSLRSISQPNSVAGRRDSSTSKTSVVGDVLVRRGGPRFAQHHARNQPTGTLARRRVITRSCKRDSARMVEQILVRIGIATRPEKSFKSVTRRRESRRATVPGIVEVTQLENGHPTRPYQIPKSHIRRGIQTAGLFRVLTRGRNNPTGNRSCKTVRASPKIDLNGPNSLTSISYRTHPEYRFHDHEDEDEDENETVSESSQPHAILG